ncbi:MAG: WG repeat-containing protein [Terracidiphilus sp.]|jgi:hypothetical protein
MADNHDLLILPNRGDSSLVLSDGCNGLAKRGRRDSASLIAQKVGETVLARIRFTSSPFRIEAGKTMRSTSHYGLIDNTGKLVLDFVYNEIEPFSGGLAAFSDCWVQRRTFADFREELFNSGAGHWGYLDHFGKVVITPKFERARGFSEGLAGVEINGKWGYIYKDGTFAIEPRYDKVRDFKGGLAIAKLGSKCGFINNTGAFVIDPQFSFLWEFCDNLACADVEGKYGYINHNGNFEIELKYDSMSCSDLFARNFHNGVAIVRDFNGFDTALGMDGRTIYRCAEKEESIQMFNDGIALVCKSDENYYINTLGQSILHDSEGDEENNPDDAFEAVNDFSEGLGVVAGWFIPGPGDNMWRLWRFADRKGGSQLYGYVNKQGEVEISLQFYFAGPFKNGLAVVDPNGDKKYGYIDTTGSVVIEAGFSDAHDFKNGLAKVKESGKWGFIDITGKIVVPCLYGQPEYFVDDFEKITI